LYDAFIATDGDARGLTLPQIHGSMRKTFRNRFNRSKHGNEPMDGVSRARRFCGSAMHRRRRGANRWNTPRRMCIAWSGDFK
jgi:hypothetical protein